MQDPITPTIVPPRATCGELLDSRRTVRCGEPVPRGTAQCSSCYYQSQALGTRFADALYDDYRSWRGVLAFNLAMGALLWAAACNATPVLAMRATTRELDPADLERLRAVIARAPVCDAGGDA